jgi:hypothetical protein
MNQLPRALFLRPRFILQELRLAHTFLMLFLEKATKEVGFDSMDLPRIALLLAVL